jgi:signal transduction histidine kinase
MTRAACAGVAFLAEGWSGGADERGEDMTGPSCAASPRTGGDEVRPNAAAAEVRAAQVASLYGHVPLAVFVSVLNAVLLAVALVPDAAVPQPPALAWLAAMLAVAALRLGLWLAWRRDPAAFLHASRWAVIGTATSALAGLLWGGGATLLWPASEAAQLFWVFVLGGMCAGAVALHHAHLSTAVAFLLPAGLPVALLYALEGSLRGAIAAAMILVFLAALIAVARHSSAQFRNLTLLKREVERQARDLEAARARLGQEIEDHRATAATLHQAQKMESLGQLTGGIAHDFNNLLMAVLGSLALLRKRLPPDDARAARLLENAVQGADRGAALTQRLLAFSRRQALRPETVALPTLVEGMAQLLQRSIGPAHRLVIDVPATLPPIHVDPGQLELAVLNLVLNARDAMPGGGEITIAGREEGTGLPTGLKPGAHVVLSVADGGEGMDEATLARATEPFFTTKGIGKGTGLGLSMADGLAAQSGGRLVLRSARGQGTVAELWLPRAGAAPAAVAGEADAAPDRAARRLRVLLVDDDPLVLASTSGLIEEIGHEVTEAEGGVPALARAGATGPPDVLVTDFGMPGMTGLELAAALRRQWPALPVVVVTGYAELQEGADGGVTWLHKPFAQAELAAAIETAAAGHG